MQKVGSVSRFREGMESYAALSREEKEALRMRGSRTTEPVYVVFPVQKKDWKEHYSKSQYCFMGREGDRVVVGMIMAKRHYDERALPLGTRPMTDEELRQYQLWAEATENYPRPFKKASS